MNFTLNSLKACSFPWISYSKVDEYLLNRLFLIIFSHCSSNHPIPECSTLHELEDSAIELESTYIDTTDMHGDSEELLGKYFKKYPENIKEFVCFEYIFI